MSIVVRFAPSPTGKLHVGNARLALVNWLFARQQSGVFLLRLDDTDTERSTEAYAEQIETDLRWMGLDWDRYAKQSDRLDRYDLAAEQLKRAGRLYPAYETPEELGLKRKAALNAGRPPIYDRAALRLSEADRVALEAEGRVPHWRFKLEDTPIDWADLVRGPVHFEGRDLSDPVLIREDGRPLYSLSSVVDDIELGITHVVRGEDHVANTAMQVQLFQALGGDVPVFGHLTLLSGAEGEKLSKRIGSLSIEELRGTEGVEPMALASLLARLGTSEAIVAEADMARLIEAFDFDKFARGAPRFDPEELKRLNARLVHEMPFADAQEKLSALGLDEIDEAFWLTVRENIDRLTDAQDWWQVSNGPVIPTAEDLDFTRAAGELLPAEPFDTETWGAWSGAVKAATGRKGKALFLPLRQALTGRNHGPELKNLLPLIGRVRALKRLNGETA